MANKQDLKIRSHAAPRKKKDGRPAAVPPPVQQSPVPPAYTYRESPREAPEADAPILKEVPPKKRRRSGRSLIWMVFSRLVLVGVLLTGGYLLWQNWEKIAPDSLVIWVEEKLSGGAGGEGYPVSVAGGSVLHMSEIEGNLALLSDTSFTILNSRGGEAVRRPHTFSAPILKTAGKYAVLAETGSTRLSLETRAQTLWSVTLEHPIISADVSRNGTTAVITSGGQSYNAEIVVFDKKGKEIYRRSRKRQAVDVAVSPGGDRVAIASIAAENGAIKSYLEIFTFAADKDAAFTHEASGILLAAVDYLASGQTVAVGDTALWIADEKTGALKQTDFGGQQLLGYAPGDDRVALVTQAYGATDGCRLLAVTADGATAYTADIREAYRHVAADKNGVYLLTGSAVHVFGAAAETGVLEVPSDGRLIGTLGDKIMVLGLTTLRQYDRPAA